MVMEERQASIWDLMLEVLVSPGKGMEKVAERRPVGAALAIIVGLSLFALAMRLLSGPPAVGSLPPELESEFGTAFADALDRIQPALAMAGSLLGSVALLVWWFIRAAVYRLLGEWMIGTGDGRAMLATLGFAALPGLLRPPLELMANRLQSPFLSLLVSLAFWLWSVVLTILAIRASFRTSTGQALAVFLIPMGALIGFVILATLVLVITVVSMSAGL